MRMAYTCTVIALMVLFIMPSQSIMQFTYECEGKNATATTYSYLKEPRIEETGFARGLKSGSFNYLENGDINLKENIDYYYGNGTNITNSTVKHALVVDFKGDRGISEFFGRGYFANNRWISAWKKIRYEESKNMKVNGWSMVPRPSNSIKVDASVFMNSSENASSTYIFDYYAEIGNGAIETDDAAGWTNRSGPRKYDWQYQTRTVGKDLKITNDLVESEGLITAGGPEGDWLPCCYSGTVPTITTRHDVDYVWPSDVVIATLEADKQLPTKKLTSKQVVPAQLASTAMVSAQYANTYTKSSLMIGSMASIPEAGIVAAGPSAHISHLYARPSIKIGSIASVPDMMPFTQATSGQSGDLYYVKKNLKVGMVTAFPDVQFASSPNGTGTISSITPPILENITCNDSSCDGYNCIYTYDEDSGGATEGKKISIKRGDTRNIRVSAYVFEIRANVTKTFGDRTYDDAQQERYKITVTNNGDVPLRNVSVTAEMARGMMYDRSLKYFESGTNAPLIPSRVPEDFKDDEKTKVTWDLGIMQPNENITILMETYQQKGVNKNDLSVKAVGTAPDNIEVKASANSAETVSCPPSSPFGFKPDEDEGAIAIAKDLGMADLFKIPSCPKWTWTNQSI